MKKHCKEEKTVLSSETKIIKIVFILIVSLADTIFPQIYLNGFCKYESFPVAEGMNSIYPINFNADSYNDLFIMNKSTGKGVTVLGEANGLFRSGKSVSSVLPFTNFVPVYDFFGRQESYAFVSRKTRTVGFVRFKGIGNYLVSKTITFNSFPENISAADINRDGKKELLVSGPAFQGVAIVYQTPIGLIKKQIVEKGSFSQSVFVDLNYDGYPDFAAFELTNNQLHFYYNNTRGEFRHTRSIQLNQPIRQLQTFDFNLDFYPDLLFSTEKSIVIYFGDGAASYEQQSIIVTKHTPDKYIYGDFNKDGKIGLAYLNKENTSISIFFKKDDYSFSEEMIYLKREGLVDVSTYYSKFVDGFIALSNKGQVYLVSNLISFSDKAKLHFASKPRLLGSFDYANNGIIDLCYIDEDKKSFDMVIRDNAGIPEYIYSIPLYLNYSHYLVDDENPQIKYFYFFSRNERSIEILEVNLESFQYKRNYLYTEGKILDVHILKKPDEPYSKVQAAFIKNGNLKTTVFSYKDFRYTSLTSRTLASKVIDGRIESNLLMYFWTKSDSTYTLFSQSGNDGTQAKELFSYISSAGEPKILTIFDLLNLEHKVLLTKIKKQGSEDIVISNSEHSNFLSLNGSANILLSEGIILSEGDFRPFSLKKLFLYLPHKKTLNSVQYLRNKRQLLITELEELGEVEDFIVRKFSANQYYVIYSDYEEQCLVFKRL